MQSKAHDNFYNDLKSKRSEPGQPDVGIFLIHAGSEKCPANHSSGPPSVVAAFIRSVSHHGA